MSNNSNSNNYYNDYNDLDAQVALATTAILDDNTKKQTQDNTKEQTQDNAKEEKNLSLLYKLKYLKAKNYYLINK